MRLRSASDYDDDDDAAADDDDDDCADDVDDDDTPVGGGGSPVTQTLSGRGRLLQVCLCSQDCAKVRPLNSR